MIAPVAEDRPRFAFGENWASFAAQLTDNQIVSATEGLQRLLPAYLFVGRSFLDLGCGSGLHALAALRLGVRTLMAVDLDPLSAHTTRAVLTTHAHRDDWTVRHTNLFDLSPHDVGQWDIVYHGACCIIRAASAPPWRGPHRLSPRAAIW